MTPVAVKDEIRMLAAYEEPAAEEMPMFAENRVHQRSSGNPYPCKVVVKVDRAHRSERPFRIITLENEYLRIEIMPELGGRIYSACDKRTGYDFFYKQHVIKPALIGLLGSWISGGCEFNWPCHHRPSTFMPVDVAIERHDNGAVTVWMSENEPLDRMKGMVGVHLAPGEARFDTRMKVFNRTAQRHSFLWWENAAVPVNEQYRLIFPPDVHYVQFHYRKNVTSYPIASGVYNGIRLGDHTDISWHKNTRQPTSYFCAESDYDFFGGYDEGKRCGVIHVADHTVSVGKKMFTWAYNQLSRSWENALTDTDGAYAELMASSYSLNQPDFAWLMPYECKEFSQMWYPVGDIGAPVCTCAEAAVSMENGKAGIQVTVPLQHAVLTINGKTHRLDATPGAGVTIPVDGELQSFVLTDEGGRTLLAYDRPAAGEVKPMPDTIPDNPTLDKLTTAQELYLMGVHVDQYRDPAIRPDRYWRDAIARDPAYVPALTALAGYELEHLRVNEADTLAMRAWKKATMRNFHPESGELQYLIARIHEAMGDDAQAWKWYSQAAWAQDARGRAMTRLAMLEGRRGRYEAMADDAQKALREHATNETAMLLLAIALQHTSPEKAAAVFEALRAQDALNMTARAVEIGAVPALYDAMGTDPCQSALDIASDLVECGETALAAAVLKNLPEKTAQTEYVYAYLTGDAAALEQARKLKTGIAYPSRVLEYHALKAAVAQNEADATALNLLACMLYAKENYAEAEALWVRAQQADPNNYMVCRNLAVSRYSHLDRRDEALQLLDKALALHPHDGQLIWEKAHLMCRLHQEPRAIAAFLMEEKNPREDVTVELCRALSMAGEYTQVLDILHDQTFTPCEGGEHAVAEPYMFAHHALGRKALREGDAETALRHFRAAQTLPDNLGAGLWNEVLLVPHQYYEAVCLNKLGKEDEALPLLRHILALKQDYFTNMHLPELPCWQAMACRQLGLDSRAQELIAAHMRAQQEAAGARDAGYYRTTPFFISYMEDARTLRGAACAWQMAMAHFAAGDTDKAAALAREAIAGEPSYLYARLIAE